MMCYNAEEAMLCRVAVIDPSAQTVVYKTVSEKEISRCAGMELVGHHVIRNSHASYGLFHNPTITLNAFSIHNHLVYGAAVLYEFDREGRTLDIQQHHPEPRWLMFGDERTPSSQ